MRNLQNIRKLLFFNPSLEATILKNASGKGRVMGCNFFHNNQKSGGWFSIDWQIFKNKMCKDCIGLFYILGVGKGIRDDNAKEEEIFLKVYLLISITLLKERNHLEGLYRVLYRMADTYFFSAWLKLSISSLVILHLSIRGNSFSLFQ